MASSVTKQWYLDPGILLPTTHAHGGVPTILHFEVSEIVRY